MLDSGPETVEDGQMGRGREPARTTATTLSHPPTRPIRDNPEVQRDACAYDEDRVATPKT